jgi:hypothetical protein
MAFKKYKRTYELTLSQEMLGTKAADPELHKKYIAGKRPEGVDQAEVEALPPVDEELYKGSSVFLRDKEKPAILDYQVKGFFKGSQGAMNRTKDKSVHMGAYKKALSECLFVSPRIIPLVLPKDGAVGWCERPLRVSGPQGERVSLARSEEVPIGTTLTIEITVLMESLWECVENCLEYGELFGLGQWRNSGKGRFTYKQIVKEEEAPA